MKRILFPVLLFALALALQAQNNKPIVNDKTIFEEKNGIVAVEAEFFYNQTGSDVRQWYITSKNDLPNLSPDPDGSHVVATSNNAYIEILPDTRVTHADKLVAGESFSNVPGQIGILHYKVNFNTPGKYYVWVRAHSTGPEDNGIHVGIDGEWPESGQRMQWCVGKHTWRWESKQRTDKVHCGEPYLIYLDINEPGVHDIQFSMREDGFEWDKFILTTDRNFVPEVGIGPKVTIKSGSVPSAFPEVEQPYIDKIRYATERNTVVVASELNIENSTFYNDKDKWLAVNPNDRKDGSVSFPFPYKSGSYDLVFVAVGENDGSSDFEVLVNDRSVGTFTAPLSKEMFEVGPKYNDLWESIAINKNDIVTVKAKIASADGKEYSRARWAGIAFAPVTIGKTILATKTTQSKPEVKKAPAKEPKLPFSDATKRKTDGDGTVVISGELKQWHKVTLTLDGPFAHELDKKPNTFTDYNMMVTFTHSSGTPSYTTPGYFAADGDAGNSSADSGTKWRAHLSPDKKGTWNYTISFKEGELAAVNNSGVDMPKYSNISGELKVQKSDKTGRDFRGKGRLEYVQKHHLQFMGTKEYFIKAGSDAPETLLAYEGFDATYTMKKNVPIKEFKDHAQDWKAEYPTWKDGKGKNLIGALGYLSDKGINAFSFLTYNAGGDGDNIWPFISRNEKFHYDCSKLDQWGVVFDFAQSQGLYLHFKTQENESDDNIQGHDKVTIITESLDGGDLGPERKLYYRELAARYSYILALNWNMGEENTQSTKQQKDMIQYISTVDAYNHNVIIHTFPSEQEKVYNPLIGNKSVLTGLSLQNDWKAVFKLTKKWLDASDKAGKAWVVANDEQGSASQGVPPDPGYKGYEASTISYDIHDIRKQTLYGNYMAGGAGVEYYFGYKLPENDLVCQDFRSRDKSWDYASIAINFFSEHIPFQDMKNADELIGNTNGSKDKHCLAKKGEFYLVYLAYTNTSTLDLTGEKGKYKVYWFNPKTGGKLIQTNIKSIKAGSVVDLGVAPKGGDDWMIIVEK